MHLVLIRKLEFDKASFLASLRTHSPGAIEIDAASLTSLPAAGSTTGKPVVVIDQSDGPAIVPAKADLDTLFEQRRVILIVRREHPCSIFEQMCARDDVARIVITSRNKSLLADMIKLWTDALDEAALRRLDEKAKELGVSERILIENASSNMCAVITQLPVGRKGLVIAGGGNNGADVLSCARKLSSKGYEIDVALLCPRPPNEEVAFQRGILGKIGRMHLIAQDSDIASLEELSKDKDFILEGIFGIGLTRTPEGLFARVIEFINNAGIKVISCDIPSGLPCDRKDPALHAVKADYTITFLAPKKGFFLNGLSFCGKIIVTDIGFSQRILNG